jgi:hypothetical protein
LPPGALFLAALAALLVLVALLRLLGRALRVAAARRRLAAARERGAWGEARAEGLLRRRGFHIEGRQVGATYHLGVDGDPLAVDLRADYLVSAGGRRYVAEVKTGTLAPRLSTATTRRQLLEYRVAFDVDGVLLVDAEDDRVQLVEFPLAGQGPGGAGAGRLLWLGAGIAAGVLATLAARAL